MVFLQRLARLGQVVEVKTVALQAPYMQGGLQSSCPAPWARRGARLCLPQACVPNHHKLRALRRNGSPFSDESDGEVEGVS